MDPAAARAYVAQHVLRSCDFEERVLRVTNFTEALLEELFPMAHGVEEPASVSFCLRYVLEAARLAVFGALEGAEGLRMGQETVRDTWRGRCGAQMQVLRLCDTLRVYNTPRSVSTPDRTSSDVKCQHFAEFVQPTPALKSLGVAVAYSTDQCLVFVDNVIYDPCRCVPCASTPGAALDLVSVRSSPQCRLPLDPRTLLRASPVGWWGLDGPDAAARGAFDDFSASPWNLLDEDALLSAVLGGTPGSVSNAPSGSGTPWYQLEGRMSQTAEQCDMIQDYWPESSALPLGYHVTVPCAHEDCAYRSFLQAFALDDSASSADPVLVYQHDLTRDPAYVDSHHGAGGLCRRNTLVEDMPETNMMRYCTRSPRRAEDYAVYGRDTVAPEYGEWACTAASGETPWPDHTQNPTRVDSALRGVGTVPNMPPEGGDSMYPATLDDLWGVGPVQEVQGRWQGRCTDYDLRTCTYDATAPSSTGAGGAAARRPPRTAAPGPTATRPARTTPSARSGGPARACACTGSSSACGTATARASRCAPASGPACPSS